MADSIRQQIVVLVCFIAFLEIFRLWYKHWYLAPARVGKRGERRVARVLAKGLSPDYFVLNDIYLPLPDGTTTQIDHIVVSRYGVFVIETKTYSGWIFGDAKAAQWTQTIYRKKSRFQNPLRQNYKHKCALAQNLGISRDYFYDIVVFPDDCKFKTQMPPEVVNLRNLIHYVKSFAKPVVKDKNVPEIAGAILEWAATIDETAKKKHEDNLDKSHSPVSIHGPVPKCPYCGQKMVLRVNRKTKERFYGCPGYPECRGMREIAQVF